MTDTHGWKDALAAAFPLQGDERLLIIVFKDSQPNVLQMFGQDQATMKADTLVTALQAAEKAQDANKAVAKKVKRCFPAQNSLVKIDQAFSFYELTFSVAACVRDYFPA